MYRLNVNVWCSVMQLVPREETEASNSRAKCERQIQARQDKALFWLHTLMNFPDMWEEQKNITALRQKLQIYFCQILYKHLKIYSKTHTHIHGCFALYCRQCTIWLLLISSVWPEQCFSPELTILDNPNPKLHVLRPSKDCQGVTLVTLRPWQNCRMMEAATKVIYYTKWKESV